MVIVITQHITGKTSFIEDFSKVVGVVGNIANVQNF